MRKKANPPLEGSNIQTKPNIEEGERAPGKETGRESTKETRTQVSISEKVCTVTLDWAEMLV
jgi:hypothetical protein